MESADEGFGQPFYGREAVGPKVAKGCRRDVFRFHVGKLFVGENTGNAKAFG
jgi:hypothetical protein